MVEGPASSDVGAVLAALKREGPHFHASVENPANWQLSERVLDWVAATVRPGWQTLETGAGYSTVLLIAGGAHHTAISPAPREHERISEWCAAHGVDPGSATFIASPSQDVLPAMDPVPLDLVLIDGDHSFPFPFLDWGYTAGRLRKGGLMVVDDTDIPTGAVLRDFLASETGRWELERELGVATVFRKTCDDPFVHAAWRAQPWCETAYAATRRRRERGPLGLRWLALRVPGVRRVAPVLYRRFRDRDG
jgi:predicted O-methyltransferase YrrM